jgi:hypothetical protein
MPVGGAVTWQRLYAPEVFIESLKNRCFEVKRNYFINYYSYIVPRLDISTVTKNYENNHLLWKKLQFRHLYKRCKLTTELISL